MKSWLKAADLCQIHSYSGAARLPHTPDRGYKPTAHTQSARKLLPIGLFRAITIYYENRLAKLTLDEAERPKIDPEFEDVTEGEEVERKKKPKNKWAQLEAVTGAGPRLRFIAQDIVSHCEKRIEAMDGKAMIVCMSRRICIDLYRELSR